MSTEKNNLRDENQIFFQKADFFKIMLFLTVIYTHTYRLNVLKSSG